MALDWPAFDAPLLRRVAAAFLVRRKAIKHQAGLSCEREFSKSATGTVERLNLDARGGHLRLSIWADGVMWLAVSVLGLGRGAGWVFQDTFYGDLNDVPAEALLEMFEATLALPFGSNPDGERERLRGVWERVRPYAGS